MRAVQLIKDTMLRKPTRIRSLYKIPQVRITSNLYRLYIICNQTFSKNISNENTISDIKELTDFKKRLYTYMIMFPHKDDLEDAIDFCRAILCS